MYPDIIAIHTALRIRVLSFRFQVNNLKPGI
jgi:hypothetical protein